jgi:hypothetical protein
VLGKAGDFIGDRLIFFNYYSLPFTSLSLSRSFSWKGCHVQEVLKQGKFYRSAQGCSQVVRKALLVTELVDGIAKRSSLIIWRTLKNTLFLTLSSVFYVLE